MQEQPSQNISETEIIIIGGGIIGLAIAYELAGKGEKVILVEKNEVGIEASWAAGGMLEPITEDAENNAFLELCLKSVKQYPSWLERLKQDSGIDSEYNDTGGMVVAYSEKEVKALEKDYAFAKSKGIAAQLLSPEKVKSKEPLISEKIQGGVFMSIDKCLNNRKVTKALKEAIIKKGVMIKEYTEVKSIWEEQGNVKGIITAAGKIHAKKVINCAGAWTTQLTEEIKIKPIKGHMIRFDISSLLTINNQIHTTITDGHVYIVPKENKTVVVGSTLEDKGFNKTVSEEDCAELQKKAIRLIPSLEDCPVIEKWTGLRPKGMDNMPIIGKLKEGLYVATAHYRDGILLAPITAKLMAENILEGKENPIVSPKRFLK